NGEVEGMLVTDEPAVEPLAQETQHRTARRGRIGTEGHGANVKCGRGEGNPGCLRFAIRKLQSLVARVASKPGGPPRIPPGRDGIAWSASRSTGLTRGISMPASRERRRSSSRP